MFGALVSGALVFGTLVFDTLVFGTLAFGAHRMVPGFRLTAARGMVPGFRFIDVRGMVSCVVASGVLLVGAHGMVSGVLLVGTYGMLFRTLLFSAPSARMFSARVASGARVSGTQTVSRAPVFGTHMVYVAIFRRSGMSLVTRSIIVLAIQVFAARCPSVALGAGVALGADGAVFRVFPASRDVVLPTVPIPLLIRAISWLALPCDVRTARSPGVGPRSPAGGSFGIYGT